MFQTTHPVLRYERLTIDLQTALHSIWLCNSDNPTLNFKPPQCSVIHPTDRLPDSFFISISVVEWDSPRLISINNCSNSPADITDSGVNKPLVINPKTHDIVCTSQDILVIKFDIDEGDRKVTYIFNIEFSSPNELTIYYTVVYPQN